METKLRLLPLPRNEKLRKSLQHTEGCDDCFTLAVDTAGVKAPCSLDYIQHALSPATSHLAFAASTFSTVRRVRA